ncbi:MAG TPA: hypothetical protein VMZ52_14010 [Bryobacteraceae bacterium]|nr:hypothetical protein [Bryobacteraceae bacterium]
MNKARVSLLMGVALLSLPMNASKSEVTPFSFVVAAGTCAAAPGGLTGSGLLRIVTIDNGGHTGLVTNLIGTATDPAGGKWIFGDHDVFSPNEEAPTLLIETFHLIGQGSLPNLSIQVILKVLADGTVVVNRERGLDVVACAG